MGSLSDFAENELMDHVFNAAYTPAATIYLALATADPTDAATGASMNEVANANGYTRKAISFGAGASRKVAQNADVTFDEATGSWGTVTHWAIVDSGTYGAGNALAHGAFSASKSPIAGSTLSVASGQIEISFAAGEITDYLVHKLLDLMFRNTAYSKPVTYLALTTSVLTDTSSGAISEPASGAYARKLVNVNGGASPTWDLSSGGNVDNTHDITIGPASGASWGTIVAVGVVDSATTGVGNVLFYDNDLTDTAVADGDSIRFTAGNCDWTMS